MVAQVCFPGFGFSRFQGFCWMEAALLCVNGCGPHPHPSAGHPWQETGGPFSPLQPSSVSAPGQEGRGWPLRKSLWPSHSVRRRKPGVNPPESHGGNLKNSPCKGEQGSQIQNPLGSPFPQGSSRTPRTPLSPTAAFGPCPSLQHH